MRVDSYYDKQTHKITDTRTTIKSVKIPGTNVW